MSERAVYVYVAGPLSDMPAQYLANVSNMSRVCRELAEDGYTPINPAGDMLEGLMSGEAWPLSLYQGRSMNLLRLLAGRDDACLYVFNDTHADGRTSGGVAGEVDEAERLSIPTFITRYAMDRWRAGL